MEKYNYVKPEMKVVLLKSESSILTTSPTTPIEDWQNGGNQLDF